MSAPSPCPSLAEWLNIATEKLALPAKERIKLEITSHFQDALESSLADGLTEANAQAKALADLGDARSAARRFRRKHLTAAEVKIIEEKIHRKSPWPLPFILVTNLLSGAALVDMAFVQFQRHQRAWMLALSLAVVYLGVVSTYYFLTKRKKLRPNVSVVVLIGFMLDFVQASALVFIFGHCGSGVGTCGCVLLGQLIGTRHEIRLWLKLRRMADVWQEMPPPMKN